MARVVIVVKNAQVKFGPLAGDGSVNIATLTDYGCQVTEARITAKPNTTTVPATFCSPASDVNVPSSFTLELGGLQDWGRTDTSPSFSEYLFINDANIVGFAFYLAGATNPSASGQVSVAAGDFGGKAGEPLVLTGSLPIIGYPNITDKSGAALRTTPATGATAGTPGTWSPAGSTPPTSVANLIAGTPNAVTASPTTAWTTGQYVQTGTAGVPGQAHWSGSAWVTGVA
jgi:hypothetical protein